MSQQSEKIPTDQKPETQPEQAERTRGLKVRTSIRAGDWTWNDGGKT